MRRAGVPSTEPRTEPSIEWLFRRGLTISGIVLLGVVGRGLLHIIFDDQGNLLFVPVTAIGASLGTVVFYTSLLTALLYAVAVGVSFALDARNVD